MSENERLDWNEYFMSIAKLASIRSACSRLKVGCVIVNNNKIIGEGWHQKSGNNHAEVAAINQVKDKILLQKSTLYVNLEPCTHHGKTPPCVDTIKKFSIPKVVIGSIDPNPCSQKLQSLYCSSY